MILHAKGDKMNLLEFAFVFSICAIFYAFALPSQNQSLLIAQKSLHHHLQHAQILALSDNRHFLHTSHIHTLAQNYPAIHQERLLSQSKNALWQFQLHLGRQVYTTFSYSVFIDTPRAAKSTDFDSRPMAGDIIAKDFSSRCISGYNNTNISTECKNNALFEARLAESINVENLQIYAPNVCIERDTARLYFDSFGRGFCAKIPTPLPSGFQIRVVRNALYKDICVLPNGRITNTLR